MSKDKCCGNCKHFNEEDVMGFGYCEYHENTRQCAYSCQFHEDAPEVINGWTEITPDNVDELYNIKEEFLMIAFKLGDKIYYQHKPLMRPTLNTLANSKGYYYYVLPELNTDGTE